MGKYDGMNRLVWSGLLLAIVAVWGWTFVLVKDAVEVYGVIPFLAVRFAIGSACMGLFVWRYADRRTLKTGGLIGIALALAYLLQTLGLDRSTATNTGVITGLFIVFAPLARRLLFGVRTSPVRNAAILMCFFSCKRSLYCLKDTKRVNINIDHSIC